MLLSQLETFIPKLRIYNDQANENVSIQNTSCDIELECVVNQITSILSLAEPDDRKNLFDRLFAAEQFQNFYGQKDLIKERIFR